MCIQMLTEIPPLDISLRLIYVRHNIGKTGNADNMGYIAKITIFDRIWMTSDGILIERETLN